MACDKLENLLLDEDNVTQNLGGTLTFSHGSSLAQIVDSISTSSVSASPPSTPLNDNSPKIYINRHTSNNSTIDIKFEVISTDIVGENKDKHVEYSILLMNTIGMDSMPAKIIKRYSELNSLRRNLINLEPDFIKHIPFPSKKLIGNFTSETLLERSKAFENLLTQVFSCKKLRFSHIFIDFLYGIQAVECYRLIENCLYEKATDLLVNCWKIQTKIYSLKSINCAMMLIGIVACHYSLNAHDQANIYADLAIQNFPEPPSILISSSSTSSSRSSAAFITARSPSSSPLSSSLNNSYEVWLIALLRTNIRICSSLGKDQKLYEKKILQLQSRGYSIEQKESLLEMILHNKKLWLSLVLGDGEWCDMHVQ